MKRLAWHKIGLILICGLIATGCDQNEKSQTNKENWESANLENLSSSTLANQSLDELLETLNNLALFPDRITAIDDSCLEEIGAINSFLVTDRTVTCQVQFENEEEPVTIDLPITVNPPNQNNDNPDGGDPITDPVDDNPDGDDLITDNPGSGGGVIITDPGSGGGVIITDPGSGGGVIITDPDSGGGVIITDPPNPDPPIAVSESQSVAGLGFFSVLLVSKRILNCIRRKYQVKEKSSFYDN
jgi:hypothetical protein